MICRFALVWMKRARNDESASCFFGATGIRVVSRPSGKGTIAEKDEISRSTALAVSSSPEISTHAQSARCRQESGGTARSNRG